MTLDRNIPYGSLQVPRRQSSLMTATCSPRPEIHEWTRRNCSTAGDPVRTRPLYPRRTSRPCTNYRHFTTFNWVKLGHQGLGFRVPMPGPVYTLSLNSPYSSFQIQRRRSSLQTTVCSPQPEIHDGHGESALQPEILFGHGNHVPGVHRATEQTIVIFPLSISYN